jgi:hypothetical protein
MILSIAITSGRPENPVEKERQRRTSQFLSEYQTGQGRKLL